MSVSSTANSARQSAAAPDGPDATGDSTTSAAPSPRPQQSSPGRRWLRFLLFSVVLIAGASAAWAGWNHYREQSFLRRCEAARELGDWHTLLSVTEQWTAWQPDSGTAWLMAAEACQELDRLEDAAQALGHVPPDDSRAAVSYHEKANLEWTVLNQPLQALQTTERLLALEPRAMEARARKISFYALNLRRVPMLKEIREAVRLGVEPREAYTYLILADKLSFTNGRDMNSRWLASAPDELRFKIGLAIHTAMSIDSNVDATRTADGLELQKQAAQQLDWFLEGAPHDIVLLTYAMDRAYEAGDVSRMAELLQQVDESGVEDHMVWVYRAWYHRNRDQLEQADSSIQEALRLHPLSPMAHHEFAALLRRQNEPGVVEHQALAARGRELRSQLLHSPDAVNLREGLLQDIADYARDCGDRQVAEALQSRLQPVSGALPW